MQTPKSPRTAVVAVVAMVAIATVAVLAVWLWPGKTGNPVPAPRSVSFGESPGPQVATRGEQQLILTPEQLQHAGLKIETVGEKPSSDPAGQMKTGVVQANTYRDTPGVPLPAAIIPSVNTALRQHLKPPQTAAT